MSAGTPAPSPSAADEMGLDLRLSLEELVEFDADGLEIYGLGRCLFDEIYGVDAVVHCYGNHDQPIYHKRTYCEISLAKGAARDAVARWVGEQAGLPVESTAPSWRNVLGPPPYGWWVLGERLRFKVPNTFTPLRSGVTDVELADLAALKPHDDRLLLDGSRWVDAVALRVAAKHYAELAHERMRLQAHLCR